MSVFIFPPASAASTTGALSLTVANASSQSGSDWTDSGGLLVGTYPALRAGVVSVNNTSWAGDLLIWDLSDLFGEDILVSAEPVITMDWITDTGPGEASVLGFGLCAAVNLAGVNIGASSRWSNLYSDGAGKEGINSKRNTSTGQTSTVRGGPGLVRVTPILQKDEWAYHAVTQTHTDGGLNPALSAQTTQDNLTSTHKIFAWLSGGPASAAVGEVVWKGTMQINYGGGRS